MFNTVKKYSLIIILMVLLTYLCWTAIHYATTDTTPKHWDYANHLYRSLDYYDAFVRHDYKYFLLEYTHYPPFMYWVLVGYFVLFGYSSFTIILCNFSLLLSLLGVIYWYTKRMTNSFFADITGIFALGALLQIMHSYNQYTPLYDFMLDFPLLVTTAVAYCIIMYSVRKNICSTRMSVCIGLTVGLAMLTKWTAMTLLVIPFFLYLYHCWKQKNFSLIGVTLMTTALSGGWWYGINFKALMSDWTIWKYDYEQINTSSIYINDLKNLIPLSLIWIVPALPIFYRSIRKHYFTSAKDTLEAVSRSWPVWEYINIELSFLIFFLLPIHDFRFLYPSIFLFYMILFGSILRRTEASHIKWLFGGVVLYTLISVLLFQPKISTDSYSMHNLQVFIETQKPSSIGFYQEDDTQSFNRANSLLFFTELTLIKHNVLSYLLLNDYGNRDGCSVQSTPEILVIYTATPQLVNSSWHYDFTNKCPKQFRDTYHVIRKETAADGTLTYFQKNINLQ